jgi:hypothetical protein
MTERISPESMHRILGISPVTPMTPSAMASALKVAFCPLHDPNQRLERFADALKETLKACGACVLDDGEAEGADGRIRPGTVVIAPGSFPDHLLPINRVSTLYNNVIVGVYDEPPPVAQGDDPQKTLDAVVGRLAWDMVHLVIYVTGSSWTICSMNGGVTSFDTPLPELKDVLSTLVPKLTAQVVPPRAGEIDIRPGALDTSASAFATVARDFVECGQIWDGNPLLMSHTSREGLAYRNGFYRKIVARYLDDRSGMSYGFFARQLPLHAPPAIDADRIGNLLPDETVEVSIAGRVLSVPIPEVRIVTTRSGCRKTAVDSRYDLVETGLRRGRVWLSTPAGLPRELAVRPSFDTLTIVAHAVGNAMVSSILQALKPDARFPGLLRASGAAMTHWHHYPDEGFLPCGYVVHGNGNPPVSCSTPQSASYSLLGKLDALDRSITEGTEYLGDVHIEPGHGTNMVGTLSLAETAKMLHGEMVTPVCGVSTG